MRTLRFLTVLAVLLVMSATSAFANLTAKVKSFDFLVDDSGSMMMTHVPSGEVKMELAKNALLRVNEAIPTSLNYNGGLHTFAPYEELLPIGAWNQAEMQDKIAGMSSEKDAFGRMTPMGIGFDEVTTNLVKGMASPAAIVIVTDGVSNDGPDPMKELRALYEVNPAVCVHFISVADSEVGATTIDSLAAANPNRCSRVVSATDLINDNAIRDQFVSDVFYSGEGHTVVLMNSVQFALGSANLDNASKGILIEAAAFIKAEEGNFTIAGHTCDIGSESLNQNLSERRAASVVNFLVKQGVDRSRLQAVGYGESAPRVPNTKESNRRLNRRVEIVPAN